MGRYAVPRQADLVAMGADLVVMGEEPAGSVSALLAARNWLRVLLVDPSGPRHASKA